MTGKSAVQLIISSWSNTRTCIVTRPNGIDLVHELVEARYERRLLAVQKHLNTVKLRIIDELSYVPFTAVGSKLHLAGRTQV